MSRRNSFTLTVMVIIMALLAIFVGYLIGNWLIQVVTGTPETGQQVSQEKIIEEDIIEDETNKENQNSDSSQGSFNNNDRKTTDSKKPVTESQINQSISDEVYVVQVGAFNNYNNALTLRNELENKGFQVVIDDDQVPYKVQVGVTEEKENAEKTEDQLKSLGYDAFVTH